MEELRRIYRQALAGRIEALETAMAAGTEESAATIRRVAHSLRGSGGTYGFPEISAAAADVELAAPETLPTLLQSLLAVMRAAATPAATRQRILIVDDDPELQLLLRAILAGETREILTAETYAEAQERIANDAFDLLILDLFLPDGDGRSLLLKVRERVATSNVPVIVLSATDAPHTKAECFALGADLYFEKPFDPDTLAAAAADRLRRSERERQGLRDPDSGFLNRNGLRLTFERNADGNARTLQLYDRALPVVPLLPDTSPGGGGGAASGHDPGAAVEQATQAMVSGLRRLADAGIAVGRLSRSRFAVLAAAGTPLPAPSELAADGGAPPASALIEVARDATFDDALTRCESLLRGARPGEVAREGEDAAGARILLVEDDELVSSILRHRLTREGFHVTHCADGETAWEHGSGGSFDLIILDVKIPVLDGFQLLERFRALPSLRDTRIVMLTSMGGEHDIVRALEIGADDYIIKPFSPVEVIARVHRLVGRR